MLFIKIKEIKNQEVIMFFEDNTLVGCIKNHIWDNETDFSFLLKYLSNINWRFQKFSDFIVDEKDYHFEDWIDSYNSYERIYKFNTGEVYKVFYDDFGNNSVGITLKEFFKFIKENSGVDLKFKD